MAQTVVFTVVYDLVQVQSRLKASQSLTLKVYELRKAAVKLYARVAKFGGSSPRLSELEFPKPFCPPSVRPGL